MDTENMWNKEIIAKKETLSTTWCASDAPGDPYAVRWRPFPKTSSSLDTGTDSPHMDEPMTLAHSKPPILIRQIFYRALSVALCKRLSQDVIFLIPQQGKKSFHLGVTFSFCLLQPR